MTVTRVAARNGNGGDLRQGGCPVAKGHLTAFPGSGAACSNCRAVPNPLSTPGNAARPPARLRYSQREPMRVS